jgi:hypothetical protein
MSMDHEVNKLVDCDARLRISLNQPHFTGQKNHFGVIINKVNESDGMCETGASL